MVVRLMDVRVPAVAACCLVLGVARESASGELY